MSAERHDEFNELLPTDFIRAEDSEPVKTDHIFDEEDTQLPVAQPFQPHRKVRAATPDEIAKQKEGKKSKPRFVFGDHFYRFIGHKRVNGKWRVRGVAKVTGREIFLTWADHQASVNAKKLNANETKH